MREGETAGRHGTLVYVLLLCMPVLLACGDEPGGFDLGDPTASNGSAEEGYAVWVSSYQAEARSLGGTRLVHRTTDRMWAPRIAVSPDGGRLVVSFSVGEGPHATFYRPGLGTWSQPEMMPVLPRLSMIDDRGNATFLTGLTAIRYRADGAWQPSFGLSEATAATWFDLGSNSQGDMLAVWNQYTEEGGYELLSRTYSESAGAWGDLQAIDGTYLHGTSSTPRFAMGKAGHAAVIWETSTVDVQRFDPDLQAWMPAQRVDQPPERNWYASLPVVAVDAEGNVTAVWMHGPFVAADPLGCMCVLRGLNVFAARYRAADGVWSPPQLIGPGTEVSSDASQRYEGPEVKANQRGDLVVLWRQDDELHGSAYDADGDSWDPASTIAAPPTRLGQVHYGLGPTGNAVLFFQASSGPPQMVSYDSASRTWSDPAEVPVEGTQDAELSEVVFDAQGNGTLLWFRGD